MIGPDICIRPTNQNARSETHAPLIQLPDEMLLAIFSKVISVRDLGHLPCVATHLRLANDRTVWSYVGQRIGLEKGLSKNQILDEIKRTQEMAHVILQPEEKSEDSFNVAWLGDTYRKIQPVVTNDLQTLWYVCKGAINEQGPLHKDGVSRAFSAWVEEKQTQLQVSLQTLSLHQMPMTTLPRQIQQLFWLQQIYIYGCGLTHIPQEIGQCTALQKVTLGNNALKILPESIGTLPNLTRLDVSHNQLERLPDSLGKSLNLKELWANDNKLKELPNLTNVRGLECLHAEDNALTNIPFPTVSMANLKEFWVQGNNITVLPCDLQRLEGQIAPHSDGPALCVDAAVFDST